MAGPDVVDADPSGRSEPGRQNLLRFGDEGVDLAGQDPHDLTLEIDTPKSRSNATIRSTVD
ncbi:hypothetical protein [Mesorhizobium sp. M0203]|uniref:hypothetical protein n=1 Tax=Mesorhizobium sp. M0203 TaxID=2956912 RepID=UPI003336C902